MLGVNEYNQLLNYSRKFCKNRKVDYMDLAHDVLIAEGFGAMSINTLFWRTYDTYNLPEIGFDVIKEHKEHCRKIEYKYCYKCNQPLPAELFVHGESKKAVTKDCKICYTARIVTDRETLADGYIKQLLYKYNKQEDIEVVRQRIAGKRERKSTDIKVRRREAVKRCTATARENLTDSYIRRLILDCKVPKEAITPQMIAERRQSLLLKRMKKAA